MAQKIKYSKAKEGELPICPYCEEELPEVKTAGQQGVLSMTHARIYFCPFCKKVLGFGAVS